MSPAKKRISNRPPAKKRISNRPFPSGSISKRSLCYENQFSFILKLELIIISKISHLDLL